MPSAELIKDSPPPAKESIQDLFTKIRAGTPVIWFQTDDVDYAEAEITAAFRSYREHLQSQAARAAVGDEAPRDMRLYYWDCVRGLRSPQDDEETSSFIGNKPVVEARDLLDALIARGQDCVVLARNLDLRLVAQAAGLAGTIPESCIPIFQRVENFFPVGKQRHAHLVVITDSAVTPLRLRRRIRLIKYDRPSDADLAEIVESFIDPKMGEIDVEAVVRACTGLSFEAAEQAITEAKAATGTIDRQEIRKFKIAEINKQGKLQLPADQVTFADVGGLVSLKRAVKQRLLATMQLGPEERKEFGSKGVLLAGPTRTGKTFVANALAGETGCQLIMVNFATLKGGIVGSSVENVLSTIEAIEYQAPGVILFMDEVDKTIVDPDRVADTSGVSGDMNSVLLPWTQLAVRKGIFLVCACNRFWHLPDEFRSRFTKVYFVDLPLRAEKDELWQIFMNKLGLPEQEIPTDNNWTGDDIEKCCQEARLLGLPLKEVAMEAQITHSDDSESLGKMREEAEKSKLLAANFEGIYTTAKYKLRCETKATFKAPAPGAKPKRNIR